MNQIPNIEDKVTQNIQNYEKEKQDEKLKRNKNSKKKSQTKKNYKKLPSLLKPRKERSNNYNEIENNGKNSDIIWDKKIIDEQIERKLKPRNKINELKIQYPKGESSDLYEIGLNEVNRVNLTEEQLQNSMNYLKENIQLLKNKEHFINFANMLGLKINYDEFENLEDERKMTLLNTFINKFNKEVNDINKER